MNNNLINNLTNNDKFFLIAGPCVIESEEHCLYMADKIGQICAKLGIFYIFKASFDKANRTSIDSNRGPGIDKGLQILQKVKDTYNVPICTDVHESWQCELVAKVADIIQIPAFLCRQTDLLLAAGLTGKCVNVKKGQFCNDKTMQNAYDKVKSTGNHNIILTDRGTMLGYDDLVVDFRNLVKMRENKGALIVQDITHSLQQPNRGNFTHGLRYLIPTIARAAIAVGVNGIFMEVHDDPEKALSDATTQWRLDKLEILLEELLKIHEVSNGLLTNYLDE
jgi:2-dehydro-3-deoxyphosphooctonate aldolase (KDO 8-P synthase)